MLIYKATNKINNKSYIGQTTETLDIRIRRHLYSIKTRRNYYFCNALRKYGKENFT
jgi:hypothetical protein